MELFSSGSTRLLYSLTSLYAFFSTIANITYHGAKKYTIQRYTLFSLDRESCWRCPLLFYIFPPSLLPFKVRFKISKAILSDHPRLLLKGRGEDEEATEEVVKESSSRRTSWGRQERAPREERSNTQEERNVLWEQHWEDIERIQTQVLAFHRHCRRQFFSTASTTTRLKSLK